MQFFSFLTYDEDVKKIFLPLLIFCLFVIFHYALPSRISASNHTPTFTLQPLGQYYAHQPLQAHSGDCTPGGSAILTWYALNWTERHSRGPIAVQADGSVDIPMRWTNHLGQEEIGFPDPGQYFVILRCLDPDNSSRDSLPQQHTALEARPKLDTVGNPPFNGNEEIQFTVSSCPSESDVVFYAENLIELRVISHQTYRTNTSGQHTFPVRFLDGGPWELFVTCGEGSNHDSPESTTNIHRLTITAAEPILHPVNDPPYFIDEVIDFEAEGCPANTNAYFKTDKPPQYIADNRFQDEAITDGSGKALLQYRFPATGSWEIWVDCGLGSSKDKSRPGNIQNIVINEAAPITPSITLPPPPPVCNREDPVTKKCLTVNTPFGPIDTDPASFVTSIFRLVLSISGGIALIIIIYAGYTLMTSRGIPESIQKAKELLTAALVGLLFIIFSFVIFEFITDDILGIPGFSSTPSTAPPPSPFPTSLPIPTQCPSLPCPI